MTRLPDAGVPEHVQCCLQPVDGADKAPVRLLGPAARAPEVGREDEAGEESEEEQEADSDGAPAEQPDLAYLHENVAETTVAVDPVHHVGPVQMMQALQGTLGALQEQAARIAKHEKTPTDAKQQRCSSACCRRGWQAYPAQHGSRCAVRRSFIR